MSSEISIRLFMGVVKETEYQLTLGMNVFTNATYSDAYLLVPNSVSKEKYQAAPG